MGQNLWKNRKPPEGGSHDLVGSFPYSMIPVQEILAPASPLGWEVKSSTPWWTITALPRMSLFSSPQPMHHSPVEKSTVAFPWASATKFPMSPLWYPSAAPHLPWGWKVGFQCPPVEVPSAEEQSAFSWRWMACSPSDRPLKVAFMTTWP